MNKYISLPNGLFASIAMIASFSLLTTLAQAGELDDISQMADQGQVGQAIDRVNNYLSANPKNAQAMFMKGVLLAEQGRRDEAIGVFTEVTERFPNLPEPYNNLAVLYADQGQFDKARKALEAAIKTHPSYATAHENLGDIYARMASDAYDKALQLDTSNTRAQGKLQLIKDLFGTGNKTVIDSKASAKITNPIRPADSKPSETKNLEQAKNNDTEVIAAINNWAQSWSSKNLNQYFASYGAGFKPAKGESRKDWEEQRRERIAKPAKIEVKVSNIKVKFLDVNNVRVVFKQSYRADGKPIFTSKTLVMQKEGNNWFIEQELASK